MATSQKRKLTVDGTSVEIIETVEAYGDEFHRVVSNCGDIDDWVAESDINR